MGFLLIIPILAFDVWLALTTGKRVGKDIIVGRKWGRLAIIILTGLALAVWFTFYAKYNMGKNMRIMSFPVPAVFFHLEDGQWVDFIVAQPFLFFGQATDFVTGLILPLIPFKIAEFLRTVKQELR